MPSLKPARVKVIVNPHANHGRGREVVPIINDELSDWTDFDLTVTELPQQAYDIAAAIEDYDAIIAAGGDGTVYEIVNGLAHHRLDIPVGLIPTGSGNDLSKALNIPRNPVAAIKRIKTNTRRKIDLGLVNGYYYANSLAVGFDARVAHLANQIKDKTKRTGLSLYMTALLQIVRRDYYGHEIRIQMDGGELIEQKMLLAAVNNGPIYGGGFKITPGADVNDGFLDICIIDDLPRWELFFRLPFAVAGRHTWMKKAHIFRAKSVIIESERDLPAALDGELIIDRSYRAEIVPSALTILGA